MSSPSWLEKGSAQFFSCGTINLTNSLYLPARVAFLKFYRYYIMFAAKSRVFNVLVILSALFHRNVYKYFLKYRFYLWIIWYIKISGLDTTESFNLDNVQHTWPCSFTVCGIIYWIWLFLLTGRDSTDKQLRRNKMTHLWQSLLQLLKNDSFSSILSWSSKDCRVFKLNNSEKVAQRRGMFKRNKATSYKKPSPALRYYYQPGNIKKVGQYISLYVHGG